MSDREEYMAKLDKIQRDLNWIIRYLMKRDEPMQIPPYNPNQTHPWPSGRPYQESSTTCSKCGMTFKGITSYSCQDPECPTFFNTSC